MAQARPGRPKTQMSLATVDYKPPAAPKDLTPSLRNEWDELIQNPLLSRVDDSLLLDYIQTASLRDEARETLLANGLLLTGAKGNLVTNPAWKIVRDCQQHLLKLRQLMMLTPRARAELRSAGLLAAPDEADGIETD